MLYLTKASMDWFSGSGRSTSPLVRHVHCFYKVAMGLENLIDGNHRVVVNVVDSLGVLPNGRGVGRNHVTGEFTGPLGTLQDPLLPGQGRLSSSKPRQNVLRCSHGGKGAPDIISLYVGEQLDEHLLGNVLGQGLLIYSLQHIFVATRQKVHL